MYRKIISLLLVGLLVFTAVPISTLADEVLLEGNSLADGYSGQAPEYAFHSLDGRPVTMELAGGISPMASGTLREVSYPQYTWISNLEPGGVTYIGAWCMYYINGQLAYCVEPLNGNTIDGSVYQSIATWSGLSSWQQNRIMQVMGYGYPYVGNSIPDHIATQILIWEIAFGYVDNNLNYTWTGLRDFFCNEWAGVSTAYNSIRAAVLSHGAIPSFGRSTNAAALTYEMPWSGSLTLPDTNGVLSGFSVASKPAAVNASISGNTLNLTTVNPGAAAGNIRLTKTTNIKGLVFWQSGSEQIKATATGATETVEAYVKLRVPSTGKLTIEKVDSVTGQALPNATIQLKQGNTIIATVTTGSDGKVTLPNEIIPGTYQIHEISAPTGYFILDEPVSITIVAGQHHTVMIKDIPKSEIQLVKVDSVTNEPLDGVTFNIMKSDGTDIGDFVTANGGVISVGDLTAGTYIITEIATLPTHVLDSTPTTITLTAGETAVVELSNIPYPTLEIIKLDEQDNSVALEGFTFRLMETDGTVIGDYVTDANGRILIENTLLAGDYLIQEIAVPLPAEYVLDDTIHKITLAWGQTTSITQENTRTATLELLKRDSESGATIPNVSFELHSPEGKNLGTFTTDESGYILFSTDLPPGKYTLIEVKTSPIHILDNTPFTVTLLPGETTLIERENQRQKGRVQIFKVSGGHNPITGDKENDTLQGAIFEMHNDRGELVEVLETDENGYAVSGMHDIGMYTLKEVKAPDYYLTNGEPITIHIRCHLDVVKLTVKNPPVVPEVSVTKYGPAKAMAGTSIIYAFEEIMNKSNVPLRDFHWWDELPTEAVRLEQIETGTWNDETVTIDLQIRTNKNKAFRTIKRSLTSYENHVIDCSPEALGLAEDEYVIEFRLWFGTVPMGFREEQRPKVTVRILDIVQDGYSFTNETGVAGRYRDKWVIGRDNCSTTATNPPKGILPRTGR